MSKKIRSTTIIGVVHNGQAALGGDGQVTLGQTVVKATARKLRRLDEGRILAGFAGSAADGLTLFEKFETKLKEANGNLLRASVELAKDWRTDRVLRRLEALLLVAACVKVSWVLESTDLISVPDGTPGPATI